MLHNHTSQRPAPRRTTRSSLAKRRRAALRVELLADRNLLAGVDFNASTVDLELFAANIESSMLGSATSNAVGYAYSLSAGTPGSPSHDSVSNGVGQARTEGDGDLPFESSTRMEAASASKPLTAAAILKLLQDKVLAGDDPPETDEALRNAVEAELDENMIAYLPETWQENAGPVDIVTIRNLLTHTSGFKSYNLTHDELEELIIDGVEAVVGTSEYTTTNFSLLREMLPFMWDAVDNDILNGHAPTSDLPADMQAALLADWDTIDVAPDQLSATLYKHYVQTNVLELAGIENADTRTCIDDDDTPACSGGEDTAALVYDFFGDTGTDTGDQTLKAGGRGWVLSADNWRQILLNLRYNDGILLPPIREMLQPSPTDDILGFREASGLFGAKYYGHMGGNFEGGEPFDSSQSWTIWNEDEDLPTAVSRHRVNTAIVNFPNDVVAALVVNSQIGGAPWDAADIVGVDVNGNGTIEEDTDEDDFGEVGVNNGSWKSEILKHAYEDALVGFVIDGNAEKNKFVVRYQPGDDSILQVRLDGGLVLSRPVATLASLTLNGRQGVDKFDIRHLPATVSLTINGGGGDDVMRFSTMGAHAGEFVSLIAGDIWIDGGNGDADRVVINDSVGTSDEYTLREHAFEATLYHAQFGFADVERIDFTANQQDNVIRVSETGVSVDVTIDAGLGDDEVILSGIGVLSSVDVATGGGTDSVHLTDAADFSEITLAGPDFGTPSNDTFLIGDGGHHEIRGSVTINGGNGHDVFLLGDGDVSLITGSVTIDGGSGADEIRLNDTEATIDRHLKMRHTSAGERITAPGSAFGGVQYDFVEFAHVEGGNQNDLFEVRSVGVRVEQLTLWGGPGDDRFQIAGKTNRLDNILAVVDVHGEEDPAQNPNEQPPEPQDHDVLQILDQDYDLNDYFVLDAIDVYGYVNKQDFELRYSGMEDILLKTGTADNIIDVEATPSSSGPFRISGRAGRDTVRVAPATHDLQHLHSELHFYGGGGTDDLLRVFDNNSADVGDFMMTATQIQREGAASITYKATENIDWFLNDQDNNVIVNGTPVGAQIHILAAAGNDTLSVRQLAGELTFVGDEGEQDEVTFHGTSGTDEFVIHGFQIVLGDGVLTTDQVERRSVNGRGGTNGVTIQGSTAVPELFHLQPDTKRHTGTLGIGPFGAVDYARIQAWEVFGNSDGEDSLRVDGATHASNRPVRDVFELRLGATGSYDDPVLVLNNSARNDRLTLRNYHNIDVPQIDSLRGADTFNVIVVPGGNIAGRSLSLDGGSSSHRDVLNVEYQTGAAAFWSDFGDGSGEMEFLYEETLDQLFELEYEAFEEVNLGRISDE